MDPNPSNERKQEEPEADHLLEFSLFANRPPIERQRQQLPEWVQLEREVQVHLDLYIPRIFDQNFKIATAYGDLAQGYRRLAEEQATYQQQLNWLQRNPGAIEGLNQQAANLEGLGEYVLNNGVAAERMGVDRINLFQDPDFPEALTGTMDEGERIAFERIRFENQQAADFAVLQGQAAIRGDLGNEYQRLAQQYEALNNQWIALQNNDDDGDEDGVALILNAVQNYVEAQQAANVRRRLEGQVQHLENNRRQLLAGELDREGQQQLAAGLLINQLIQGGIVRPVAPACNLF
jgi:hypothetical protein